MVLVLSLLLASAPPTPGASAPDPRLPSCERGDVGVCLELMRTGHPEAKRILAEHWRRGCQKLDAYACDQLSLHTDDEDERLRAMEVACTGGIGLACYALSLKRVSAHDAAGAQRFRLRACELGQPDACEELEQVKRYERALAHRERCGPRDLLACQVAGDALREIGLVRMTPDDEAALPLYEKGCAGGHLPSCTGVAQVLLRRRPGDERGVRLLREGCRAGLALACRELHRLEPPPQP